MTKRAGRAPAELRRALAQLAASQTQIEKAAGELGNFSSNSAHDSLVDFMHSELMRISGRLQSVGETLGHLAELQAAGSINERDADV